MTALRVLAYVLALVAFAGSAYLLGGAFPPEHVDTRMEPSP